jgi:hypothetical protein
MVIVQWDEKLNKMHTFRRPLLKRRTNRFLAMDHSLEDQKQLEGQFMVLLPLTPLSRCFVDLRHWHLVCGAFIVIVADHVNGR